MPGKRQTVDVLEANGRKHLTNEEKFNRRSAEVSVSPAKKAKPPAWLNDDALRKEFRAIGKDLIAAGLYTDLDSDNLGYYITARSQWIKATGFVEEYLTIADSKNVNIWSRIQDRFFKQAKICAASMGLTISDRCKLVIPQALQQDDASCEDEFTKALRERQKAASGV